MPSPPSTIPNDAYAQLIKALHPAPPKILEIEILPSTYPPKILHDFPALGVPKSLLIPLYLQARTTFSAHLSSHDPDSYHAALQATAITLLFDPNHLTAANFRKRHIQRSCGKEAEKDRRAQDAEKGTEAVRRELMFLESLVTSPLSKHAKSSTLWAQRLWIVQSFFGSAARDDAGEETIWMTDMGDVVRGFWERELVIVMKAGERHARNYYAWQYARRLFSFVCSEGAELVGRKRLDRRSLRESIGLVHGWCLMHPRDISGWAFGVFLLEQLRGAGDAGYGEEDERKGLEDDIGRFASETKDFVRKYQWRGESIQWFLESMKTLGIDV